MTAIGCDVLVVGGGIAGVSVAALVAAERRVVLVEAETELSRHSTGRSAAAYLPSYGSELVRSLTVASRPHFDEFSERTGIALLTPRSLLWLASDEASNVAALALADTMPDLESLSADDAVALCPVLRPDVVRAAMLDRAAADIDVASLHASYVSQLRARGGEIMRAAPLQSARRTRTGWRVRCGEYDVECDVIVDAAGAWADEVSTRCGIAPIGLTPCRRSAFIAPLPADVPSCRDWPLVVDGRERFYFRPEGSGHLLMSPAEETAVPPGDVRPDEMAIAHALDRINEVLTTTLRRVTHSWAGLRTFAPDRVPVIGAARDDPAFVFLAGQGGYGIQMAPAIAILAAHSLGVGSPPPSTDGRNRP